MDNVIAAINALFFEYKHALPTSVAKLPQSGSDRIYFRVYFEAETYIATYNLHAKENQTFIAFSRHFKQAGLPVPEVFCVNEEQTIYLQADLGTVSLFCVITYYF